MYQNTDLDAPAQLSLLERRLGIGSFQLKNDSLVVSEGFAQLFNLLPGDGLNELLTTLVTADQGKLKDALISKGADELSCELRNGETVTLSWEEHERVVHGYARASHGESDSHAVAAQLQRAEMEAATATQAKNRFLANISHELRTPLTAVMGFLQLVMTSELTPDQTRNIDLAVDNATRLQSLIDNVLEVAKIESNELKLEVVPYDLREMIATLDSLLAPKAELKGLRFVVQVEDSYHELVGDRDKTRQIIIALVDNAIKFTSHGSVRLLVSTADQRLQIEVVDTGSGIAAAKQSELFEPFQERLDYQSEYGQATGLGLAICKSYVDLMFGDIEVKSAPGKGSVFTVSIPVNGILQTVEVEDDDDDDDFLDDDFEDLEDEWDVLKQVVQELHVDVKRELQRALLRADPVGFRAALQGTPIAAEPLHQLEFMVDSYQYDEVLKLVEH